MAYASQSLHFSSFCFFTLLVLAEPVVGFRVKLIHYDSVYSPFYKANETIADRAKRAIESSLARAAYIQATTSAKINDFEAPLLTMYNGVAFLANISIGQPPLVQFVILDTGSSLFWVQCRPCGKCFEQRSPIFNPSKSSTYSKVLFKSPDCFKSRDYNRGPNEECIYEKKYADGSTSMGFVAKETLTFETSSKVPVKKSNMTIGCAFFSNVSFVESSGILGIGPIQTSLASQLGSKFSICIGNLNDHRYEYNHVIFGDGAILAGPSTPLESYSHYRLTLEGITIQGRQLNNIGPIKMIIDTGSTLSYLPQEAFDVLSDEVEALATENDLQRASSYSSSMKLCFQGMLSRDVPDFFSVVTLDLAGGVKLALGPNSLFKQINIYTFCMAITTHPSGLNLIGIHALQFHRFGFDVHKEKAYINKIDCKFLGE